MSKVGPAGGSLAGGESVPGGGGAYLMQSVSRGLSLQLVGGSMWTCPQSGLFSAQGNPEESQDRPEDPANGPHCNKESSLESAVTCSKDASAQPTAISFFGALRIPVSHLWTRRKREAL